MWFLRLDRRSFNIRILYALLLILQPLKSSSNGTFILGNYPYGGTENCMHFPKKTTKDNSVCNIHSRKTRVFYLKTFLVPQTATLLNFSYWICIVFIIYTTNNEISLFHHFAYQNILKFICLESLNSKVRYAKILI